MSPSSDFDIDYFATLYSIVQCIYFVFTTQFVLYIKCCIFSVNSISSDNTLIIFVFNSVLS